jgi:2-polyprenyl-3-methyl-5-hydroxy-6-metoxy-1,4-benzoquinol methylase
MSEEFLQRIRDRYEGEGGRRWERIETGLAKTYLEQNAVIGRKRVAELLPTRLDASNGTRILDGGCGLGTVARRLGERGARVTGVDLVPSFVRRAASGTREGRVRFLEGDLADVVEDEPGGGRFDLLLLMEVLEDYELPDRRNLMERVASAGIPRIFLVFRTPPSGLLGRLLPESAGGVIDPIELLRWVHLNLPYRQRRQEVVHVRNYQVQLSDLVLAETDP